MMTQQTDSVLGEPLPEVETGILTCLKEQDLQGTNLRYQKLYDRIAWFYNGLITFARYFFAEGRKHPLTHYYERFAIKPDEKVLEVSIGTAANILLLPSGADYYGVDISLGMLRRAKKSLTKHHREATLIHGAAERLPFKDEVFDVVFHVGGFNFFSDKAAAVSEMIRVAKPGARFLISDETEQVAKKAERIPIARGFFKNRKEEIRPPVHLLPTGMQNVQLTTVCDNTLWVLTFEK